MYKRYFKRILDFTLSLIMLIALSPVLLVIAALARVNLGNPVIFKQNRPGKDEKIFEMYKFRTMTDERDENGTLLPDGIRLTKFGRLLRSTSLDELPELFNILKGDMSFVGPRPLLPEYLPLYNKTQKRRHEIRPGLTGWAQVNGRNSITWEKKFEMDVEYVDRVSFKLDLKILCMTLMKVFSKEGISSETCDTVEPFKGTTAEMGEKTTNA